MTKIVVYDDEQAKTSTSALLPRLQKTFPQMAVEKAETNEVLACLDGGAGTILVIPGISGEKSFYYDLLGGDAGMEKLRGFVQRGGLLVTICAGSYLVARKTEYKAPWGPAKERTNTTPLFNAVARGPLAGLAQRPGPAWYDDCTVASIRFKTAAGWKSTGVAYGNGPALYPDAEDPDLEVLAQFIEVTGAPAAAAWKPYGAGAVLWLGILPYIGYSGQKNSGLEKVDALMEKLEPHEKDREEFWAILVGKINRYAGLKP